MERSTRRTSAVLAAVLVIGLAFTGAARADHAAEIAAREDFAAGRYDLALDRFAKLYAETLNPVYLRNIARCHQKLHEPDKAIETFRDYLAKGTTITPEERVEINGYIKEMQALRAQQAEKAKDAAPPPPPPAPARPPVVLQPVAPAPPPDLSVHAALVAQPAPPPAESPPFYARWWFWTIVGAAVAGGVVAAVALSGGTTRPPCTYPGVSVSQCK